MSKAAAVLLVSALLLGACGDDDDPAATTTTTEAESVDPVLSPEGLGDLRIGMSAEEASATGLIGEIGPGCELAGPGNEGADLVGADGFVTFQDGELVAIDVREGAETAEGIRVGDSLDDLRTAYDDVEVDTTTEDVFAFWIARVPAGIEAVVEPETEEITSLAVPQVQLCD